MTVSKDDGRFTGRTVVVTGASRGIGRAIATEFAGEGANVAIVSRDHDAVTAVAAEIAAAGTIGEIRGYAANVGDEDVSRDCAARIGDELGPIDVLVNNAATNPYYGDLSGLDVQRAEKTVRVNQFAPILWTRLALEHGLAEGEGSIVNITSIGAMTVNLNIGWYNATKAAITHLTQQLAAELAPDVRVNAVAPGLVRTEMARELWEGREDSLAEVIPLRRIGEPGDISSMVLFLAGPQASWVTGQTFVVDGGATVSPLTKRSGT